MRKLKRLSRTRTTANFKWTPFFSFKWFEKSFHDYTYALNGFHAEFPTMFRWLESQWELLKRTIAILWNDHGDRGSRFVRETFESFLERSLAGISPRNASRIEIKRDSPSQREQVHNWGQHFPNASPSPVARWDWVRSVKIRACARGPINIIHANPKRPDMMWMSKIEYGICKCNTLADGLFVTNPILSIKPYNFAIAQLNGRITKSANSHNCYRFSWPLLPLSTATVIAEVGGSSTILLCFWVKPHVVSEATIHITTVVGSKAVRIETVADFRSGDR